MRTGDDAALADPAAMSNALLNAPVLVWSGPGEENDFAFTSTYLSLDTTPNRTLTIDVYATNAAGAQRYLGSGLLTTGATGKIATDISPEKRTVVRQKLVSTKVQRVERSKINVTLTVGVRVPRTIRFYPVPREIIRLVPAYRGYLYFVLDDGTIILVDPRTYSKVLPQIHTTNGEWEGVGFLGMGGLLSALAGIACLVKRRPTWRPGIAYPL